MIVIFIILFIAIVGTAIYLMLQKSKEMPLVETGTQPTGGKVDGYKLVSLPTGTKVVINNKEYPMMNIAIVFDRLTERPYQYDVDFTFALQSGEIRFTDAGTIPINAQFRLDGKIYFGVVLAGGPAATVKEVHKIAVN